MSPASKSNKISTILKNKLHTISLKTNDNNLQEQAAYLSKQDM